MRVLFLTHSYPRQAGDAAGSFILRLAAALQAHDVDVTVLAPHAAGLPPSEVLEGVLVRRFRYAPAPYETLAYTGTMAEQVRAAWRARFALGGLLGAETWCAERHIRQLGPALLHAHWWFPSGLVASWLARWHRLPLVTTLHGSDVRLARVTRPARLAFQYVMARSSAATAVSSWLASEARGIAPEAPTPVVAPMPVAPELFTPGGRRASDRLLFVGRLNRQKGLELLLRAMTLLHAQPSLDVIGDGSDAGELRALAGALQLDDRVRWHGAQPQPRLAEFYRAATALIVPSVEEGLGLVAVEAQLCETPVIAFDSGGIADVVQQDRTGILVDTPDAGALASAIDDLLAHPERGAALGRAARAHGLSVFAPDAVAQKYAAIYTGCVARSHLR
ncbi:MAG TPA: glycosyltransferase [Gemmatimonadaceae bacterium]|nr:glycosyltransferase [Gemmatimonadaceae bacterium]